MSYDEKLVIFIGRIIRIIYVFHRDHLFHRDYFFCHIVGDFIGIIHIYIYTV